MMNSIRVIIKNMIPSRLLAYRRKIIWQREYNKGVYLLNQNPGFDIEKQAMRKANRMLPIPYPFYRLYNERDVVVRTNSNQQYCMASNQFGLKHMVYFPKSMAREDVKLIFSGLLVEQDSDSPHCYFDAKHKAGGGIVRHWGSRRLNYATEY